ncbi:MAG TPA: hypothetical protein VGR35_01280 [Tepidisphaeraceae bacterium]|nr:hypothetical protein [Tepidisphaeraceae bacterium]
MPKKTATKKKQNKTATKRIAVAAEPAAPQLTDPPPAGLYAQHAAGISRLVSLLGMHLDSFSGFFNESTHHDEVLHRQVGEAYRLFRERMEKLTDWVIGMPLSDEDYRRAHAAAKEGDSAYIAVEQLNVFTAMLLSHGHDKTPRRFVAERLQK